MPPRSSAANTLSDTMPTPPCYAIHGSPWSVTVSYRTSYAIHEPREGGFPGVHSFEIVLLTSPTRLDHASNGSLAGARSPGSSCSDQHGPRFRATFSSRGPRGFYAFEVDLDSFDGSRCIVALTSAASSTAAAETYR